MPSLSLSLGFALRNLTLKTKLLLVMLSLLLLSLSALFVLHFYRQRELISQVRDYTDDLSTALVIAQEQPAAAAGSDSQAVVRAYMEKLEKLGVKDVSYADEEEDGTPVVRGSTNPGNVGRQLVNVKPNRRKGVREYRIKGVLGEESGPPGTQRTSTFTIPILVGDRKVGYVVITRFLDDFSELSRISLMNQLFATMAVFAVGMLLALYLSRTFSRPLQDLSEAAGKVAAGDLQVQVPAAGKDEIGTLSGTFNEMVHRLRENRQLEERLHFAERSTALGRLASAMAHEIRNPLNFMNLSIDHLRERLYPEDAERKERFDSILGNVKAEISRLNRLVGDFLSFGKPMRLDPRPCALEQVVRSLASLVEAKTKDQGITLTVETEPDLPQVVADPELLKTCFLNLMINACDAMPHGGTLSVAVRRATGRPDHVDVVVRDTGHGMGPDAVKSAFEPYFSTKEAGLGIGLALTHKIVTDHGGSIELESELGRGTTATVRLPVVAGPAREESVA
jgi:signal transduction histidine kinase